MTRGTKVGAVECWAGGGYCYPCRYFVDSWYLSLYHKEIVLSLLRLRWRRACFKSAVRAS